MDYFAQPINAYEAIQPYLTRENAWMALAVLIVIQLGRIAGHLGGIRRQTTPAPALQPRPQMMRGAFKHHSSLANRLNGQNPPPSGWAQQPDPERSFMAASDYAMARD